MNSKVAKFIASRIVETGKSQVDIAREAGFNKPNIITMIKQGSTKLPLDKVGPMARALECAPTQLLALTMSEYEPETWQAIAPFLGEFLTPKEAAVISALRTKLPSSLEGHFSVDQREKLGAFLATLQKPAGGALQGSAQ